MKATWLGQAGLYIESDFASIILDPYFSNSVGEQHDPDKNRRMPVDESYFLLEPDFFVFTHNHLDHFDPETAEVYLKHQRPSTVLAPASVMPGARKAGHKYHNYVQMSRHTVWTEKGLRFRAVKAEHSDAFALGYIIEELSSGDVFYITGDTLYNDEIFDDLPNNIKVIFLPVNGVGNNMNMQDAAEFAKRSGAAIAVPLHFGMFDSLDPTAFPFENKVIPMLYREIAI